MFSCPLVSVIFQMFNVSTVAYSMGHNGLWLGEVEEIEAQMFSFAQKFNRRTAVEFSTKPAILPNCCCAFGIVIRCRFLLLCLKFVLFLLMVVLIPLQIL